MSLDLGGIFERIESIVLQLLATGGTSVDVARRVDGAVLVDPSTFSIDPAEYTAIASGVDALLNPAGASGDGLDLPATVIERPGDYRVILEPAIVDVRPGDLVTVRTCRDERLLDREFLVRELGDSSAGVVRICLCAPVVATARQAST